MTTRSGPAISKDADGLGRVQLASAAFAARKPFVKFGTHGAKGVRIAARIHNAGAPANFDMLNFERQC